MLKKIFVSLMCSTSKSREVFDEPYQVGFVVVDDWTLDAINIIQKAIIEKQIQPTCRPGFDLLECVRFYSGFKEMKERDEHYKGACDRQKERFEELLAKYSIK